MPEAELLQMPIQVPESVRYACSDKYCGYKAIDEVMLAYHIQTLHPGMYRDLHFLFRDLLFLKGHMKNLETWDEVLLALLSELSIQT